MTDLGSLRESEPERLCEPDIARYLSVSMCF